MNWVETSVTLAREVSALILRWNAVVLVANVRGKRVCSGGALSEAMANKSAVGRGGP